MTRPAAAPSTFPYPHRKASAVGPTGRPRRAAPADFTTYAPGKTLDHLCRHYVAGESTVKRWRDETGAKLYTPGVDPRPPQPRSPVPPHFREEAPLFSDRELARHYGRDPKLIRRWREECGITRKKPVAAPKPRRHTAPAHHRIRLVPGKVHLPAMKRMSAPPLAGREQDAAQHLRRFYPSVYHCTDTGRADPKGKFWRLGNAVVAPADLIERAERRGWNPDAWQELAA